MATRFRNICDGVPFTRNKPAIDTQISFFTIAYRIKFVGVIACASAVAIVGAGFDFTSFAFPTVLAFTGAGVAFTMSRTRVQDTLDATGASSSRTI